MAYIRYFLMYIYDISMVYIWYLYGIHLIYMFLWYKYGILICDSSEFSLIKFPVSSFKVYFAKLLEGKHSFHLAGESTYLKFDQLKKQLQLSIFTWPGGWGIDFWLFPLSIFCTSCFLFFG